MKKIFSCFCWIVFSLANHFVPAQTTSQLAPPTVIPPSPNAAALGKYGDIPVSTYTGVPNVTIPLHEIQLNGFSLPINLSYHASGIRVEEEASWVGLGWTLNAGGIITKSTMGKDDFVETFGYLRKSYKIPNIECGSRGIPPGRSCAGNGNGFCIGTSVIGAVSFVQDIRYMRVGDAEVDYFPVVNNGNTTYDFQPDIYYFNFAGFTGKFFIDEDGKAHLAEQRKMDIKYDYGVGSGSRSIKSWTITAEDGTKYTFSPEEYTGDYITGNWVSGWYLDKIETAGGESISFTYTGLQAYPAQMSAIQVAYYNSSKPPISSGNSSYSLSRSLKSIRCRSGSVSFETNSEHRQDIPLSVVPYSDALKPQSLSDVNVYDPAGKLLKNYKLTTSYFISAPYLSSHASSSEARAADYKRLRLESITETVHGNEKPPYIFNYEQTLLPPKTSYSRDHWGFYNGRDNNTSLIPAYKGLLPAQNGDPMWIDLPGADRNPDPLKMTACILNRIQYPTGGHTQFDFEPNEYGNQNSSDENSFVENVKLTGLSRFNTSDEGIYQGDVHFSIPKNTFVNGGKLTVQMICDNCGQNIPGQPSAPTGSAYIRLRSIVENANFSNATDVLFYSSDLQNGIQKTVDVALTPGLSYVMEIRMPKPLIKLATARLTYFTKDPQNPIPRIGGGVRIKKITDYDGMSYRNKTKEFIYGDVINERRISFGKLMLFPKYWRYSGEVVYGSNGYAQYLRPYYEFSANSNAPLGNSAQGSPVGYSKVIIMNSSGGENGKSEFEFENTEDFFFDPSLDRPFNLPAVSSKLNGYLYSQTDYVGKDGNYVPIQKTTNQYENDLGKRFIGKGLYVDYFRPSLAKEQTDLCKENYNAMYYYPIYSEWIKLVKSSQTVYNQNGQQSSFYKTETTNSYDINNRGHMQLNKTETKQSDGSTLITLITYPLDYSEQNSGFVKQLHEKFIHKVPIEIVKKRYELGQEETSAKVISGSYSTYSVSNNVYKGVESVQILETDAPVSDFMKVLPTTLPPPERYADKFSLSYGMYGNVTQSVLKDSPPTSYLWAYNGLHPVAEIKNASLSDVSVALAQIGLSEVTINNLSDGNMIRTKMAELQAKLPQAMVTTYTYEPLVGMSSQTGPDGITVFYEYDGFQRLKVVKDRQGNVLKRYQYHYTGRPLPVD